MARNNQHKPQPPLELVGPYIMQYWKMRMDDKKILELLRKHLKDTKYGIGLTKFREMRENMGLYRTKKQGHDVDSIRDAMIRLRAQYPKAGQREISGLLFHEEDMSVSRAVITSYFAIYVPDLVRQRRANRLKRKRFWAAGVNDLWAVDQHDKWKYKFGLALHSGLDPFIGRIQWLKIWWTNSNPRLILSYYLDAVQEFGSIQALRTSALPMDTLFCATGTTRVFLRSAGPSWDDHEDDIALIPNLTSLHNGSQVVAPDGTFYMGGVNNGLGLDSIQSDQLDGMMNRDEPLPPGEADVEEDDQLIAWFSDEEDAASAVNDWREESEDEIRGKIKRRQITIYLVPVTPEGTRTEAAKILANATRSFPEDMAMKDVLAHLLRHWNLDWEKDCSESLAPEHVSLRLIGNIGIQPHSTLATVGHFFDVHDRLYGNHPRKILHGPPTLRLPSPAIYLEGLITVKEFEDETGTRAPYFVHTERENRKRRVSQMSSGPELGSSKRTRSQLLTPLTMRSEFAALPGFSKVPFVFASVSVAFDGTVKIDWPDLGDEKLATSMCALQETPFDHGKTKQVHKVIYDGFPWVAKHFFDVGAGEGQVDIQENHNEIVKEATRLAKAAYFLKRFMAETKKENVDVVQGKLWLFIPE
ncbi:hypothetical protein B0H10DRAFT_2234752 [Mycena sp. CBHHK59/15]|nr:hypothetical protein B0H10DRAFT_2234752 [Mycena sp. CBHHK59/15]